MLVRPTSSDAPMYRQVMAGMRRAIEAGEFRPGDRLPAINHLAEQLVLNPNVVARAYRALAEDGVIRIDEDVVLAQDLSVAAVACTGGNSRARRARDLEQLECENRALIARVASEASERARLEREIAVAREVQERLLTQQYPAIDGVDCAGLSRAAQGVGGDYYDFIQLTGTRLGTAIGDVSGKGLPAALLMASLQAYVRSETLRRHSDLGILAATLNALVYDRSTSNRYATFFYGEYDSAAGVLDYVNAGHNAPLVIRANGSLDRLEATGPVIGLIPGCAYVQRRVTLQAGDLLLAFTDGAPEALNAGGDEWGEDRFTTSILANIDLSPRDLIQRVIADVDAFAGAAPQYDDMTVVALKVLTQESDRRRP